MASSIASENPSREMVVSPPIDLLACPMRSLLGASNQFDRRLLDFVWRSGIASHVTLMAGRMPPESITAIRRTSFVWVNRYRNLGVGCGGNRDAIVVSGHGRYRIVGQRQRVAASSVARLGAGLHRDRAVKPLLNVIAGGRNQPRQQRRRRLSRDAEPPLTFASVVKSAIRDSPKKRPPESGPFHLEETGLPVADVGDGAHRERREILQHAVGANAIFVLCVFSGHSSE